MTFTDTKMLVLIYSLSVMHCCAPLELSFVIKLGVLHFMQCFSKTFFSTYFSQGFVEFTAGIFEHSLYLRRILLTFVGCSPVEFVNSRNSSPLSIPEKRFVRLLRQLQFHFWCLSSWYVWEFKQMKDLYLRIVAPRNFFIEFIHEVRSWPDSPLRERGKVY